MLSFGKKMQRRGRLLPALVVLLFLGLAVFLWMAGRELLLSAVPKVRLPGIHGTVRSLQQYRGRVLLVSFWATTCPGCVEELPEFHHLEQIYAGRPFQMVGISMQGDNPRAIASLARVYGLHYPLLMDVGGYAAHAFGDVNLTPTNFLVDAKGRIRYRQVGSLPLADWEKRINALLPVAGKH